jgi:hypothetical protein
MIHQLKVHPEYFELLRTGLKKFEIRKDDRPFEIGHVLSLKEWSPIDRRYSGRQLHFKITCIYRGEHFGVMDGFAILGLSGRVHFHDGQRLFSSPSTTKGKP